MDITFDENKTLRFYAAIGLFSHGLRINFGYSLQEITSDFWQEQFVLPAP